MTEHEHEHHYLNRIWRVNISQESERLKNIMNINGFDATLDEARDIITKFFKSPVTQELIKTGNFPVSNGGEIRQDTLIDPKYVIAKVKDFEIIHGRDHDHGDDIEYKFTLVVTDKDSYWILDSCELQLIYGFFDYSKKEVLNVLIGVEGFN